MGSINPETRTDNAPYTVNERPIGTARPLKVITVGAGASGLNLARHIEVHMRNVEHVIYDKNADVGGTWFENKYPGCACDIPSHSYQFGWEMNPDWNHFYSPAPEILAYFQGIAHKYELYKYIRLQHAVRAATWSEELGLWNIEVDDLSTGQKVKDWCHVLINGSGILNNWRWPNIPGLHSFKGELMHSAAWKDSDLKGKTVAVLGCGSSGVQIVATIQPEVKNLITFIRTPTWITAGFAQSKAGPNGENFNFSDEQKLRFRQHPEELLAYRKGLEDELNLRFKFVMKESPEQAEAKRYSINEMKTKLAGNPKLADHLIPDFAVGCRRPTPGNGYLEALTAPNVRVITEEIQEVVPEGFKTKSGEVVPVDVFICATGFDISFYPRFTLTGRNGADIREQWAEKPEAYLSMAAENMPNYFMFLGPNAPVGHGSVLPIVEHMTKYIIRMLYKLQTQDIKSVVPRRAAIQDFMEHTDTYMTRTAWSTSCRSWFKNGKIDGPVVALHPGSRIHWFHMLAEPRYEDWEWETSEKNRFSYLGNGFSTLEDAGRDLTFYMNEQDDGYQRLWY